MRVLQVRAVVLRLALLLAASVAACDLATSPDALTPGDPLAVAAPPAGSEVEVVPSGPLNLSPGDTLTLRATTGRIGGVVRFQSADSTIASVSPGGRLTALRPGAVQITAALRGDPQVRTVVYVSVRSRGPSSLVLAGLTSPDGGQPFGDRVAGRVEAHVRLSRGDAVALQVMIDTASACIATLPRTAPGAPLAAEEDAACVVDTAAYDTVAGVARFANGPALLSARLLGGDGKVLAATEPASITLANRDTLVLRVLPQNEAPDLAGRPWAGGDVTVEAYPLLYSRTATAASVTFRYQGAESRSSTVTDTDTPFRVVLPRASLAGALDERFTVTAGSTLSDGAAGPRGASDPVRYDGVPPTPGVALARDWLGAGFAFSSLYFQPDIPDVGVGRVAPIFFVGRSSQAPGSLFAAGSRVATTDELRETGPKAYRLGYRVCDAVLNCVDREGFDFGVDLSPPSVAATNLARRAINPRQDLHVTLLEERSGLAEQPLFASVRGFYRGYGDAQCGAVEDGVKLPGARVEGRCDPEPVGQILPVPQNLAREGYYFYRLTAADRAGNRGDLGEWVVLVDRIAPEVDTFVAPSQFTPGTDFAVEAAVSDNIDVASVDFRLAFGSAGLELPFGGPLSAGATFTPDLTYSFTARASLPFVRTLTSTEGGARTTTLVNALVARVADAAGFVDTRRVDLQPAAFGGNVSLADPFPTVRSVALSAATTALCTAACRPTDATAASVTAQIVGDAGMSSFSRIYLFARDPNGLVTQLGSTSRFTVVETGTQRTYTYALEGPLTPFATGDHTLFAVALNSAGNALRTVEIPVQLFTR